ncbi:MAG: winged helix-turn-helix transcriptional regulator [Halobacteriota archaeon]
MKYFERDELDVSLIAYIDETDGAKLSELCSATGTSYSKIWYRINTLGRVGLLKLVRSRRRVLCFIADSRGE